MDLLLKERAGRVYPYLDCCGRDRYAVGLSGFPSQVQTALEQQPYSGHIFIFCGRGGDMVMLLWFDGDQLCWF